MKFLVQKDLLKKYSHLLIALLLGLIFFNVMFTLIRRFYYGEMPVFGEYIFLLIMGILFGGGIGLWRIQNYEYKKKIEKTLNDLKKSNELVIRSNKELSEMQQKLSQSQKMELIGIVASGVAHDLNNTLSASVNYPEILELEYSENIKLCENLKIIKNSGMKAAAMVNDLLTLARRGVPVEEVIN
ncbi:MAG: histidine kinase dimerization/phospho-acceptor domain-containing protein, partial [Desulfobacteraceae bacterium]